MDGLDFTLSSLYEEIAMVKDTTILDTLYKVQLLALGKPLKEKDYFSKLLLAIPDLTIEEKMGEDGFYHYSAMTPFKGEVEAREFQQKIKDSKWKDSFIAVYAGEKRTDKEFLLRLEKMGITTPPVQALPEAEKIGMVADRFKNVSIIIDSEVIQPSDTLYKIRLLALFVSIKVEGYFTRIKTEVPGLTIDETLGKNGIYKYTTGAFRGINQATELMEMIKQTGWSICFIESYDIKNNDEPVYKIKKRKVPKD